MDGIPEYEAGEVEGEEIVGRGLRLTSICKGIDPLSTE